ncbi:SCO family protein [Hahella sp. CCB-MM4]|uniref:SCO family protein n=1 Tax=Hahella sp. (strain CCB-MM4) TaxID=1926491 RepID=UPI00113FDB0B|nr:SCO family protein [Hahella sp. CCB-MM4]
MSSSKASKAKSGKSASVPLPAFIVGLGLPVVGMSLVLISVIVLWVSQANSPARPTSVEGGVRFQPAKKLQLPVLENVDGSPLTEQTMHGHWTVVNFGYLSCPDVCPVNMAAIHRALTVKEPPSLPDNITVLYVTMDPARDSAEELHDYLSYFDQSYQGATGPVQDIAEFAKNLGTVFMNNDPEPGGFYSLSHNSVLSVLNPEGGLAGQLIGSYDSAKLRKFLIDLTTASPQSK